MFTMRVDAYANIYNQQQLENLRQDNNEKAGEIFEKIFVKEMLKGMYETTQFENEEKQMGKDLWQEMGIDILSDKIVDSNILGMKEKYFEKNRFL